jgi:hypothetical protein
MIDTHALSSVTGGSADPPHKDFVSQLADSAKDDWAGANSHAGASHDAFAQHHYATGAAEFGKTTLDVLASEADIAKAALGKLKFW